MFDLSSEQIFSAPYSQILWLVKSDSEHPKVWQSRFSYRFGVGIRTDFQLKAKALSVGRSSARRFYDWSNQNIIPSKSLILLMSNSSFYRRFVLVYVFVIKFFLQIWFWVLIALVRNKFSYLFLQEKNFLLVGMAKQNGHWIMLLESMALKNIIMTQQNSVLMAFIIDHTWPKIM